MPSPEFQSDVKPAPLQLQIIVPALLAGSVAFLAVVLFLRLEMPAPENEGHLGLLTYGLVVALVPLVIGSFAVPAARTARARRGHRPDGPAGDPSPHDGEARAMGRKSSEAGRRRRATLLSRPLADAEL